jgi:hypothetical protein
MKYTVKVDHLVIAQVLGLAGISRGDPDFREIVIFLEMSYLDYQRRAQIKGLSTPAFNDKILLALVRDLQANAWQVSFLGSSHTGRTCGCREVDQGVV